MRKGNWIQTFTGRQFWPLDPRPEEIHIEDIAHALAHQCRFAGHCRIFYSVAQHSVLVSALVSQERPELSLRGLLHDASEAFLVDLPRPIKRHPEMRCYREAEEKLQSMIYERFGLDGTEGDSYVDWADNVLLATEGRDLMGAVPRDWVPLPDPLEQRIQPVGPVEAERLFLARFDEVPLSG